MLRVPAPFQALWRSPAFTICAVLCLAVGMAASTTMLQVIDTLLLRPPGGVRDPGDVRVVQFAIGRAVRPSPGSMAMHGASYDDYQALRDRLHGVRAVAGFHTERLSLGRGRDARPVTAAFVSGSYFRLLGVQPMLGRPLAGDHLDDAGSTLPVVISFDLWRGRFGGDSTVLGRSVTLGKGTYRVAGVAPAGFRGVTRIQAVDCWVPFGAAIHELFHDDRAAFEARSAGFVQPVVRLAHGSRPGALATRVAAIEKARLTGHFGAQMSGQPVAATLAQLAPGLGGDRTTDVSIALWLAAMGTIVLLIACANVAGLFLVRALSRDREIAIRYALGASRGQVARLFVAEAGTVAVLAALLATAVRSFASAIAGAAIAPELDGIRAGGDGHVIVTAGLVAIGAALACAMPAVRHSGRTHRLRLASAMTARTAAGRTVLLVGQMALATALVACAGLFVASWRHVASIPLGFSPDAVLVGRTPLFDVGYTTSRSRDAYERMAERVRGVPGVTAVSLASRIPFAEPLGNPVTIPGVAPNAIRAAARSPLGPELNVVTPAFFRTMGIVLVRGRLFDSMDVATTGAPVAIVNERMARTLWGGAALGACVEIQSWVDTATPPCSRIVGIVRDTRSGSVRQMPDLQMYTLLGQHPDVAPGALLVRGAVAPDALVGAVRDAMLGAGGDLPYADVRPLGAYLEPELRPWRLAAVIFTVFGALALALAAAGLYGVFAYAVARRTRELGVRAALGARAADIVRLVLGDALRLSAVGATLGVALAIAVGGALASLLVGVGRASPIALGGAAAAMLVVTVLAAGVPARRAARIDPVVALRDE